MTRFAAIGLDHRHIYDLVAELRAAGGTCVGYWPQTTDQRVLAGFRERFPEVPEVPERERLLDDPDIDVIVSASVPRDRAPLAIEAMRRGKDVMVDKPGIVSAAQLEAVERAVAETGRIFSICFSERFLTQTYGGILVDIASHQLDQFLVFTGAEGPEIVASTVAHFGTPEDPAFEDFGEILLRSERCSGYVRVDWFTPDGLPTWGDGRLTIVGTEGTIELRKYVDIAGRPGTDHLFLVDRTSTRHIDCAGEPLTYFKAFLDDVRNRTQTAMPQAHVFAVTRLALEAQAKAARIGLPAR
jgi:predicted dehydrogenase